MYYSSSEAVTLQNSSITGPAEQSSAQPRRRSLRCTAAILFEDRTTPLIVTTTHVSEGGVCALHSHALRVKQACKLTLSVLVGGALCKLSATARVTSCVCAGDSFRIALAFTQLDDSSATKLARLLRG